LKRFIKNFNVILLVAILLMSTFLLAGCRAEVIDNNDERCCPMYGEQHDFCLTISVNSRVGWGVDVDVSLKNISSSIQRIGFGSNGLSFRAYVNGERVFLRRSQFIDTRLIIGTIDTGEEKTERIRIRRDNMLQEQNEIEVFVSFSIFEFDEYGNPVDQTDFELNSNIIIVR